MRQNALPAFQGELQVLFIRGLSRFIDILPGFLNDRDVELDF